MKKKIIHTFEELEVYKLAREFRKEIGKLIRVC